MGPVLGFPYLPVHPLSKHKQSSAYDSSQYLRFSSAVLVTHQTCDRFHVERGKLIVTVTDNTHGPKQKIVSVIYTIH